MLNVEYKTIYFLCKLQVGLSCIAQTRLKTMLATSFRVLDFKYLFEIFKLQHKAQSLT